ncbi:hypothetical protein DF3PB_1590006 [uncultured Defluviicoccus sp.]|uniref:Uncharacterized protein n=1 Tax=metagenome TaxID=256318 RepID=A0A380T9P6_9ZZZZ|nr:hypothetical protein DF3PB_1590006 [uncultured Defluviicoccus sp.]
MHAMRSGVEARDPANPNMITSNPFSVAWLPQVHAGDTPNLRRMGRDATVPPPAHQRHPTRSRLKLCDTRHTRSCKLACQAL